MAEKNLRMAWRNLSPGCDKAHFVCHFTDAVGNIHLALDYATLRAVDMGKLSRLPEESVLTPALKNDALKSAPQVVKDGYDTQKQAARKTDSRLGGSGYNVFTELPHTEPTVS